MPGSLRGRNPSDCAIVLTLTTIVSPSHPSLLTGVSAASDKGVSFTASGSGSSWSSHLYTYSSESLSLTASSCLSSPGSKRIKESSGSTSSVSCTFSPDIAASMRSCIAISSITARRRRSSSSAARFSARRASRAFLILRTHFTMSRRHITTNTAIRNRQTITAPDHPTNEIMNSFT